MARDYAHRSRSKKKSKAQRMPWSIIIIIIVLVALLIFGLAFIRHHYLISKQIMPTQGGAPVEQATPTSVAPVKPKVTPKPTPEQAPVKFDFYNVLPKMKVSTTSETAIASKNSRYVLQLGSFNSEQAAQALQKKVRQKGFRAYVFTAFTGDQTFYRVQIGPYKNQDAAENEHDKLQDQKIPSILVPA